MPKLAELKIKTRPAPAIVASETAIKAMNVRYPHWRHKKPRIPLIHIVRRTGHNKYGRFYEITNCNRMMRYPERVTTKRWERGYRLCPKCGTSEDFIAAAEEHKKWTEDLRLKATEDELREQTARLAREKKNQETLVAVAVNLNRAGFRANVHDDHIVLYVLGEELMVTL